jgi:hypothetical protein
MIVYNSNFKVQFRAVPFTRSSLILELRLDPNQDLSYIEEYKFLGLFKRKRIKYYDTDWHAPIRFVNHPTAKYYDKNDDSHWLHFFIKNQKELDWYKNNFKTIGEFYNYQQNFL